MEDIKYFTADEDATDDLEQEELEGAVEDEEDESETRDLTVTMKISAESCFKLDQIRDYIKKSVEGHADGVEEVMEIEVDEA